MIYRKWNDYYKIAKRLYSEIGTVNVPINYEYQGVKIGDWLSRQRTYWNQKELNPYKIALLEDLGIEWDGRQNKRERNLQEFSKKVQILKEYKQKHGNTQVPSTYTVNGFALGKWVTNLRYAYKHPECRKLSADQLQMLEEVGFETTWYEARLEEEWDFHYRLLAEYVSIYGQEAVVEDTVYKDCKIGSWLHYQRGKYNTGSLSQVKYKKLYDLGIPFNSVEQRWEFLFSLASHYYQEFHNLDVPDGFIIDGEDLGRWISYQLEKYNRHDNYIS